MTRMPKETIAPETEAMGALTAAEIDCVSGAAGLVPGTARLSVADSKKAALAQQLEKAYAETHPHEYYDFRI